MLTLLPTAYEASRYDKLGAVCSTLLVVGWLIPIEAGAACVSLAMLAWLLRTRIPSFWKERALPAVAILIVALILWSVVNSWTAVSRIATVPAGESSLFACVRSLFATKAWSLLLAIVLWWGIRSCRGPLIPGITIAAVAAFASALIFHSSMHMRPYGSPSDMQEFTEWRDRIPAGSTVFVTNGYDSGSFVWFTLQRNNYLSPGQSAGVVFSRATALEVQRRSEVLSPLSDPNWKILTSLQDRSYGALPSTESAKVETSVSGSSVRRSTGFRNLSKQALIEVCQDSTLGFVISPDDVGFNPIKHVHFGIWRNWNLYDCGRVRTQVPAT
jgi:hypothetical protein